MTPEQLKEAGAFTLERVNDRGNTVLNGHWHGGRYAFDCDDEFRNGWRQFDTDQDAPYYGVWTRNSTLETFTYCEGDIILVKCPDAEHYNTEIRALCDFHAPAYSAVSLDVETGQITEYYEDRTLHFVPEEVAT